MKEQLKGIQRLEQVERYIRQSEGYVVKPWREEIEAMDITIPNPTPFREPLVPPGIDGVGVGCSLGDVSPDYIRLIKTQPYGILWGNPSMVADRNGRLAPNANTVQKRLTRKLIRDFEQEINHWVKSIEPK